MNSWELLKENGNLGNYWIEKGKIVILAELIRKKENCIKRNENWELKIWNIELEQLYWDWEIMWSEGKTGFLA